MFFFIISVRRSETRALNKYKIRECFVRIESNYTALCLQWLNRTNAVRADFCPLGRLGHRGRRSSVAAMNLYEIDGSIREVGFDDLNPVPRAQYIPQAAPPDSEEEDEDEVFCLSQNYDSDESDSDLTYCSEIEGNVGNPENGIAPLDASQACEQTEQANENNSETANSANASYLNNETNENRENVENTDKSGNGGNVVETGKWFKFIILILCLLRYRIMRIINLNYIVTMTGNNMDVNINSINNIDTIDTNAPGPSRPLRPLQPSDPSDLASTSRAVLYDPFKRSKNLPFAMYGRRRSISVFDSIPEGNKEDKDDDEGPGAPKE